MQGNVIDLCPVGALTSKPYAFTARPWELSKTESIDVMDALGSNVRVDAKGREVMRIMPRNHDGVNEEWLADRSRFIWDGLRRQRLDKPYVRVGGRLKPATWSEAFAVIAGAVKGKKVAGLVGDLVSCEAAFALKELVSGLGGTVECRTDGAKLPAGNRGGYVGTATIADIDAAQGHRAGRDQPAGRGAGAECAHPQGLADRRERGRRRRGGGPDLRLRSPRDRPRGARRARRQGARRYRQGSADGGDRRAGGADRRQTARPCSRR